MANNKIRELRKAAGLTQEQLSARLNVKRATLARYEAGTIDPPTSQLQAIASALGVSVGRLLGQETERIIIPGRLKIVEIDDPESGFFRYDIEAADDEALNYGYQILGRAGASVQTHSPQALVLAAMEKLNNDGQQKAVERVEELTEIPRYTAPEPPQDTPMPQDGTDTAPAETPPDGPQEPPEGRIQSITMICPICGQHLRGDTSTGKAYCNYCKRSFPLPQILK